MKEKNLKKKLTKNIHISLGNSLELLQSVLVQFNFR